MESFILEPEPAPALIMITVPTEFFFFAIIIVVFVMIGQSLSLVVSHFKLDPLSGTGVFLAGMTATAFLFIATVETTFGAGLFELL